MTRKSRIHWRRIKVQELCRKDILIEIAQILQVSKGIVKKVQFIVTNSEDAQRREKKFELSKKPRTKDT
jgi:hypothetical protein